MSNRQCSRIRDQKKECRKIKESCKKSQKRCPLSPRLKCDRILAETSKSDTFVFSSAKTRKSARTPPHLSMAQDYIRSIDERLYRVFGTQGFC